MNAAYATRRDVEFGALLSLTFANLALIWRQVVAYMAVAGILAFAGPLAGKELAGLIGLALYFGGQYWLYRALLRARGMLEADRIHFLAFVGLAALLIFPISLGLVLLVLPGLFLVARWIAAPSYIVARGQGAIAAAGGSWDAVRGSTGKVAGAVVLLFVLASTLGAVPNAIGRALGAATAFGDARPANVIEANILPLLLLGLSVAAYQLLGPKDNSIEEVFG